ncbi:MAG: hypothetical protein LUC83_07135, partial [Clostridiales bacterium]|nr:hypothetical protein [Clostridiales bacterium]
MNKTNAQLRRSAKQNLLGHYGTAIAALIVTELVTLILNIPFNRMTQQGIAFGSSSRMVLGIAGTLIVSLVAVLFQAGISHIHLQFARGIDTRVSEVFFAFKNRPDRYLGYGILNILLAVACVIPGSLCCIIPILNGSYTMAAIVLVILGCILLLLGCIVLIVVLLSWSMTVFILLEDNSITV